MFHTFCICFKLLKLNFLEYCVFDTMHYLIYDNFDQVYGFWEIGGLVCKKMLAYRPRKPWSEKNNSTLSPRDFFLCVCVFFVFFVFFQIFRYDNGPKESTFSKKNIIRKFWKLPFKLTLILKSELLWYAEAKHSHLFVNFTI